MVIRNLLVTLLALFFSALLPACGGDDDKTPANCAAICAQQNNLCKSANDCDKQCSSLAQLVSKTGCDTEFQEGLNCLSEKNVCDEMETACPSASFYACVSTFCAAPANAAEPLCAE